MPPPDLVAVAPPHAAVIAALHARCFDEVWDERAVLEILAMPGSFGFLCGAEVPRGFVLSRAAAGEAEILSIGVLPEMRGQGLGEVLLMAALDAAKSAGAEAMFLEVAAGNEAARALYARAGFEEVGRRAGYYGAGADALVLRLGL